VVLPAVGAIVLVRFPFSDLSQSKLRPAVVLADAGRGDQILCQITSKPYGDAGAVALDHTAFTSGSLRVVSYARPVSCSPRVTTSSRASPRC
jgi:mRNA interferase MazF